VTLERPYLASVDRVVGMIPARRNCTVCARSRASSAAG
jgi:hypothetical protein